MFASNCFVDVPTILQYENMPLVECFQEISGSRTLRCNLFSNSGDLLAVLKGTQLYKTRFGESAEIRLRHHADATVCEQNGKELFVAKRRGPTALSIEAELHTFDGSFVSCHTSVDGYINAKDQGNLQIGGLTVMGSTLVGCPIGILLYSDGGIALGASYPHQEDAEIDVPEVVVRELGLLNQRIKSS